jgi:hypothetical protein
MKEFVGCFSREPGQAMGRLVLKENSERIWVIRMAFDIEMGARNARKRKLGA